MNAGRALAVAAALVLLGASPASAIETRSFGLSGPEDGELHVPIRPGERTAAQVQVWNRQDGPLPLQLSVVPATVHADGTVSLDGDPAPVSWVSLEARSIRLGGHERRAIELEVDAPDRLPADEATVAVLAQPRTDDAPAVLQRLAVVAHLDRAGEDVVDLGAWPWVAAAAIAATLGGVVSRTGRSAGSRRRR